MSVEHFDFSDVLGLIFFLPYVILAGTSMTCSSSSSVIRNIIRWLRQAASTCSRTSFIRYNRRCYAHKPSKQTWLLWYHHKIKSFFFFPYIPNNKNKQKTSPLYDSQFYFFKLLLTKLKISLKMHEILRNNQLTQYYIQFIVYLSNYKAVNVL